MIDGLLKLPFQIIGYPLAWMAGRLGLLVAAVINAFIFRQLFCILAWNFGWTWVTSGFLLIVMIAALICTWLSVDIK